jgi:hypothetical protein
MCALCQLIETLKTCGEGVSAVERVLHFSTQLLFDVFLAPINIYRVIDMKRV